MIDTDIKIINNPDIILALKLKKYASRIDFIEYTYVAGFNLDDSYELLSKLELNFTNSKAVDYSNSIVNYIKTFEHVCILLNVNINKFYNKFKYLSKSELALKKLILITKVLNNGWQPDFNNQNEEKWYPYFKLDGKGGCSFDDCVCHDLGVYSAGAFGGCLYLKNTILAEYCGKQFIDIWKEYLLNRENIYDFIDEIKI